MLPHQEGPTKNLSDDPRTLELAQVIRRQGRKQTALIEVLHAAQRLYGWLPRPVLRYVAKEMRVPLSRVIGVATFYHLFTTEPPARHTCTVCMGTACFVLGANAIWDALAKELATVPSPSCGVAAVRLDVVRCIGSCGVAPLIEVDAEVIGPVEPDEACKKVRALVAEETES